MSLTDPTFELSTFIPNENTPCKRKKQQQQQQESAGDIKKKQNKTKQTIIHTDSYLWVFLM